VRLGLRRRIVLVAVGSFAVGLALLLIAFNVVLERRLSSEAESVLSSRVAAQRANLHVVNGRVRVREGPGDAALDGASWVFQGGRLVEPRMLPAPLRPVALRLVAQGARAEANVGDTRLLVQPGAAGHGSSATVVAAISLAPYENTQRVALIGSAAVGVILLALVGLITSRSVAGALRPVRRMADQAAAWSQHDLHRRFDVGPPRDELATLAARLNGLLERIDTSFQHEKRFSAEVAHELRTPLARQRGEIELTLRGDADEKEIRAALPMLLREVDRMTVIIDTLVAAAQAELIPDQGNASASAVVSLASDALARSASESGIVLHGPRQTLPVQVGVDLNYAVQTLLPVVDNAVRHARTRVGIAWAQRDGQAVFTITDDGPGVSAQDRETVFEPGVRGSGATRSRGAGLGLPLARRLARAVGGDVVAPPSSNGGHFEVTLPRTRDAS
jgi:two-component system, OmpR family, sensor kinase